MLKEKWIEALRSGEYEQGKNYLCADGKFCCLGVLCDIDDRIKWSPAETGVSFALFGTSVAGSVLPNEYRETAKITSGIQQRLVNMNDQGCSFGEIADWIEENMQSVEF